MIIHNMVLSDKNKKYYRICNRVPLLTNFYHVLKYIIIIYLKNDSYLSGIIDIPKKIAIVYFFRKYSTPNSIM